VEELEKSAAQPGVRLRRQSTAPRRLPRRLPEGGKGGAQAVMLTQSTLFASSSNMSQIAELTFKYRLPSVSREVDSAKASIVFI
jgi:hypothetical protein